jgi:hypothetical protein
MMFMIKRIQLRYYPLEEIEQEILLLIEEINESPTDRGVGIEGNVQQYFPSKEDALNFAKRWTKGSADSFKVKHIDGDKLDEDHPNFDPKNIKGGILYQTPGLFFGMKTASNEYGQKNSDIWLWEYSKLKLKWMKEYRNYLKGYTQLQVNWMPF